MKDKIIQNGTQNTGNFRLELEKGNRNDLKSKSKLKVKGSTMRKITRNQRGRKRQTIRDASSISSNPESDESFSVRGTKRTRKNSDQVRVLERYFVRDPKWSNFTINKVVLETGLEKNQVYKWGWERKPKNPKDEFGGYHKNQPHVDKNHRRIDLNSLATQLGMNLDKLVRKLDLTPFREQKTPTKRESSISPQKLKSAGSKKRNTKMISKSISEKFEKSKFNESPESQKIIKDVQKKTSKNILLPEEEFKTPGKSNLVYNRDLAEINKALFSQESDLQKESLWKSEKESSFFRNSFQRRIRSGINTKDMMCSEALSLRDNSVGDENINTFRRTSMADSVAGYIEMIEGQGNSKQVSPQNVTGTKELFNEIQKRVSNTPEQIIPQDKYEKYSDCEEYEEFVKNRTLGLILCSASSKRDVQVSPFCINSEDDFRNIPSWIEFKLYGSELIEELDEDIEEVLEEELLTPDFN